MAEEKKGETKNQHYVPQFYQRNFSVNGKTIGAYIADKDKTIPQAPIKHQASADYFYSENMKIEGALSDMEGLASVIIDKVIGNPKLTLTREEEYTLYVFTMIQLGRTLRQANLIQENFSKMAKMMLRKYIEAKRQSADAEEVVLITDEVLDSVEVNVNQPGLMALGTQSQIVNLCIDLKFRVLINNTDVAFLTSDNPVCMYNTYFERLGNINYALASRGLFLYFPLSDKISVMFYDDRCYKMGDRKKSYLELSQKEDVRELNKLTACNSNKVIYFKEGSISKSDVENVAKRAAKYKVVERVRTFEGFKSGTSEIVGAQHVSMFCKLRLSFMKELPNYKYKTKDNFDWNKDGFREIAYYKDEIVKASVRRKKV